MYDLRLTTSTWGCRGRLVVMRHVDGLCREMWMQPEWAWIQPPSSHPPPSGLKTCVNLFNLTLAYPSRSALHSIYIFLFFKASEWVKAEWLRLPYQKSLFQETLSDKQCVKKKKWRKQKSFKLLQNSQGATEQETLCCPSCTKLTDITEIGFCLHPCWCTDGVLSIVFISYIYSFWKLLTGIYTQVYKTPTKGECGLKNQTICVIYLMCYFKPLLLR